MGASYRAAENHWFSEIPIVTEKRDKRAPKDVVPHVLMGAHIDGTFTFDIVSGPAVPTSALARDTVRIPYVGGVVSEGLSSEEVAVDLAIAQRPELALGGAAVQEALRFWHTGGVEAAFYSQADAEEYGLSHLIGVTRRSHEVTQEYDKGNVTFEVTSQGIVLATTRVLVDHAFAQLPPAQ
jgi:hypothetical protein